MARVEKHVRKKASNSNSIASLTKWKQRILGMMIEDEELVKLLYYNTPDCLDKPTVSEDKRNALINSQVYGYRFNPMVVEVAKSWISLSMSNFVPQEGFRQFSDDYLMGFIYF